jgi:hypothetical protein
MPVTLIEKQVIPSLGMNSAMNPAEIPEGSQRKALNAVMRAINTIGKRDGTIPLTTTALGAAIKYITNYRSSNVQEDILAASGTSLYKFNGTNTLTPQTMTNVLASPDINTVAFTNSLSQSILFITDGGAVKKYTAGSPGVVVNITPAADDALPLPPNYLATINTYLPKYCWIYKGQIFVSAGTDTAYFSKPYIYDYFPSTNYQRWVRENDFINGNGLQFDDAMFIPLRKGWGYMTGATIDTMVANLFLNTTNGVIAPRSIQVITYSDGRQTIVYLSDDGVYEIFISSVFGASKQYATRPLMKEKINFASFGLTDTEMKNAVSYFDQAQSLYILSFQQGLNYYALVYDTRVSEFYQWTNVKANSFVRQAGILYYAGSEGHLKKFDPLLYSDWNESTMTTGTPVNFDMYSGLLSFEFSGDSSYLHYYVIEIQQYGVSGSVDIYIVCSNDTLTLPSAVYSETAVWGISAWGEAIFANADYTDIINSGTRLPIHKKSKYFQRRINNPRDEPFLLLKEKFIGTTSGR